MKHFLKKILGIDKIEAETQKAVELKVAAEIEAKKAMEAAELEAKKAIKIAEAAKEQERLAKLSPKERATENGEPWIAVLDTHINKENIKNGFFELDWNEHFIVQLRKSGYKGGTDEEIVDAWFSELCRNVGKDSGVDMERRGSGYVNRALRDDGRSENS